MSMIRKNFSYNIMAWTYVIISSVNTILEWIKHKTSTYTKYFTRDDSHIGLGSSSSQKEEEKLSKGVVVSSPPESRRKSQYIYLGGRKERIGNE